MAELVPAVDLAAVGAPEAVDDACRSGAFFHDGNADARIECLPTCSSAFNPARYPPVIAGEHLAAKLRGPRTLTASDALSTAGDRRVV